MLEGGATQIPDGTLSKNREAESPAPLISIGLAVYNGEKYLREAVDSILAQTFSDFELVISDNASTDSTAAICQEYSARDSRIRYHRNPTNIGGANNENLTFRLSRGKYFRWAAHDDLMAPTLLERCIEVMESDPSAVLCHTGVVTIDDDGLEIGRFYRNGAASSDPVARFRAMAMSFNALEETYGLMRSDVLRRTRLLLNYTDSDRAFMAEMALRGRFRHVAEPLFYKRLHAGNEYVDWRTRMAWFDPQLADRGSIVFPHWLQFADYFVTVARSSAPTSTRLKCWSIVLTRWFPANAKRLAKDLLVAARMWIGGRAWRKRRYALTANWD